MAAVLVALVGCTKTELVPETGREISFAVGNYAHITKTAPVTEFTSFKSKGYLYAEGVDGAQNFFGASGETISFDGTSQWNPSHPYYWPKSSNSYINFVSWYANDGTADFAPTTVTETAFEIVGRTIGANDNILIADEAWRQTSNQNQYYTVGVPTLFHHVLSRVRINMRATTLTDPEIAGVTYEVTLQSAHLESIFQTGTMKLLNADLTTAGTRAWYSNASPTLLWTTVSGSNANDIEFVNSNTDIDTSYTDILAERSVLPQNLTDGAKLVLTYSITTKSNGVVTATESGIPATFVLNTITNTTDVPISQWVPNKKYTYNIAVNPVGNEILLNPIVESDWTFAADLNATVE